jgi:hypothetical protein
MSLPGNSSAEHSGRGENRLTRDTPANGENYFKEVSLGQSHGKIDLGTFFLNSSHLGSDFYTGIFFANTIEQKRTPISVTFNCPMDIALSLFLLEIDADAEKPALTL